MAGGAHIFALVEAAVEHLVPGVGVSERSSFIAVRADEILAAGAFSVIGTKRVVADIEWAAIVAQDGLR